MTTDVATEQTSDATSSLSSLPDHTSSTSSELVTAINTTPDDTSPFEKSSLPPSSISLPILESTTLTMAESSSVVPETSTLDEQTSTSMSVTDYFTSSSTVSTPRSKPMRTRKITRRPTTTTVTATRACRTRRRTFLSTLTEQSTSAAVQQAHSLADLLHSNGRNSTSLNLSDLPPSSWNLSFQTNQSLLLDITLPSVNLQINEVETKEFSLSMNLTTSNETSHRPSEVILGHVRSEHFQLTLVTTDGINLQV